MMDFSQFNSTFECGSTLLQKLFDFLKSGCASEGFGFFVVEASA